MSVIVVVSDGIRCCMACDSQTTNNGAKAQLADPKIASAQGILFAGEGVLAFDHYIKRESAKGEPKWVGLTDLNVIAAAIADDFRAWLRDRDMLVKTDEHNAELPGQILVAKGAEFRVIDGGGYVVKLARPWHAIGSGGGEARGALHALTVDSAGTEAIVKQAGGAPLTVEYIARAAIEAACALDDGCSPPVHVMWTEP
jgi:ATP-dependent protease HslVU (ClpYQ) peptidase subunit